jgi:hypothetical protein
MQPTRWPGRAELLFDLRLSDPNRRFEFKKRRQLFIRPHKETLSVAAMRVGNPERWPLESIAETWPQLHPASARPVTAEKH